MSRMPRSFFVISAIPFFLLLAGGLLAAVIDDVRAAIQSRDYSLATRLAANESSAPVLLLKGNALRTSGSHDDAIKTYDRILTAYPASGERVKAVFGKAQSLMAKKRFAEAGTLLRGELTRLAAPDRIAAHALIYASMADELAFPKDKTVKPDWEKALALYTSAIDYGKIPQDLNFRFRAARARCLLELDGYQQHTLARQQLEELLPTLPAKAILQQAELRFLLGRACHKLGQRDAAEHQLTIAARLADAGDFPLQAAAELLETLAFPSPGRRELTRGRIVVREMLARFARDPRTGKLLFQTALAELNTGDSEAGLASLALYIRTWSDGEHAAEAHYRSAETLFKNSQHEKAMQTLRELLARFPGSGFWQQAQKLIVDVEYGEAERAFAGGNFAQAEQLWSRFMARYPLDPRTPAAAWAVGKTFENRKDYRKAVEIWQDVWQRWPQHEEAQRACLSAAELLSDKLDEYDRAIVFLQRVTIWQYKQKADARMTELREESLSLSTDRIHANSETARVTLRVRNIDKVRVRVYQLDSEAYFRSKASLLGIEKLDVELISPDKDFSYSIPNYKKHRLSEEKIPVGLPGPGTWVVQCSSSKLQSTTLVVASDLGLVTRTAPGQIIVQTTSLSTGLPAAGAEILVSNGREIFIQGKTDASGIFRHDAPGEQAAGTIAIFARRDKSIAALSPGWFNATRPESVRLVSHLAADRLAWRPGDTVRFRLTLRTKDAHGTLAIPRDEYTVSARSPAGIQVFSRTARADADGTIAGEFAIDQAEPAGLIQLAVVSSNRQSSATHTLRVEHYEKKETDISFSQFPKSPLSGDRVAVTLTASHLFGEPASARHLLWRVNEEDWQTLTSDAAGRAVLTVDTSARASGRPITLTVKPSWENREYTHTIVLAQTDLALALTPLRPLWLDSERAVLTLKATTLAGTPATRKIKLSTSLLTNGSQLPVETRDIDIAADGTLRVELSRLSAGIHLVKATASASSGETVTAEARIRVAGPRDPDKIFILPATTDLESGKPHKLRLYSRLQKPQAALVIFERDRIISQRSIVLPPGESSLTFIPDETLAPEFRVVLATATTNGFHQTDATFNLSHALKLDIKPGADTTLPGSQVNLEIAARDTSGEGTAASLFVFVIDDAIWTAVSGKRSDIVATFLPKTGLVRSSSASFTPFVYSTATGKRDQSIVDEENRRVRTATSTDMIRPNMAANGAGRMAEAQKMLRDDRPAQERGGVDAAVQNWAELAWYHTALKTSREGIARASFRLPNRTTRWRIVVVAVSGTSLFGDADRTLTAKSDLYVRLEGEPVLTSGDRMQLPIVIGNVSEKDRTGTLRWRLVDGNKKTTAEGSLEYAVAAKAVRQLLLPLQAERHGAYILEITSPDFTHAAPVLVRPASGERVTGTSAILRGAWQHVLRHAPGATGRELRLKIVAPEQLLLGDEAPYFGRTHLSGLVTGIVRATAAREYLTAIRPDDRLRLDQLKQSIAGTLQHLAVLRTTDWDNAPPSPWDTAWLGFALERCRRQGLEIDSRLADWTRQRLNGIFSSSDNNELKALALFALAGDKDLSFAWINRLYRERGSLQNRELALLALALEQAGRRDMSGELTTILASRFIRRDGQAHLPGQVCKHVGWMGQTSGTTALGALALAMVNPASPVIGEALAWLETSRGFSGWNTPAENGVIPLVHALALKQSAATSTWTARVRINGRDAGTIGNADPRTLHFRSDRIDGDETKIDVALDGRGPCLVSAELTEILPVDSKPQNSYPGRFAVSLRHPPYRIDGKQFAKGMGILAESTSGPTNELTRISRGEAFTAEITVRPNTTLPGELLVIDLPLPSGCRAVGPIDNSQILHQETLPGRIRYMVLAPDAWDSLVLVQPLVAAAEGTTALPAASVSSLAEPWKRSSAVRKPLVVTPPGSDIFAGYRFSANEMYRVGEWHYKKGDWETARKLLSECITRWQLRSEPAREIGLMLLDIAIRQQNSREAVRHFESLKEKHQDLSIPLDQAEAVADAYAKIGEHERFCQVLDGIIEARFLQEVAISGARLNANRVRDAASFLKAIWADYPDGTEQIAAVSSFAQQLFQMTTELTPEALTERGVNKDWLYDQALGLFNDLLVAAPEAVLAPEIAFSSVSLLFEREKYADAGKRALASISVYSNSHFRDSFTYLAASSLYFERRFGEAARHCTTVAERNFLQPNATVGPSRYRDYALHMLGMIRHSEQKYDEASRLYERVKTRFPDASRAIDYLRGKLLALPEITTVGAGETARLRIESRNLQTASLVLYKVDFLMLCLKQKDLQNVTGINLAGIRPSWTSQIKLGSGSPALSVISEIAVPVNETGAWLVVVKSDGIERSGMILRSDIVLDALTTEDGSVRASVHNRTSGKPLFGAQIKFIPSDGSLAKTATSDPRGMAETANARSGMIVAAVHDGQYAFRRIAATATRYRGPNEADDIGGDYKEKAMEGLKQYRSTIQSQNKDRWEQNQKLDKRGLELKNLKW